MYKSELDKREVEPAQYLAELMCIRKAKKEGKKLFRGFWSDPIWKVMFKSQLIAANGLFKLYGHVAVIHAVNRKDCEWMWSLRSPQLTPKILEEKEKIEKIEEKATREKPDVPTIEVQETEIVAPRKTFGKGKNIRNLDG